MKVLHVITGLNVGGAETMLSRLLERRDLAPDIAQEVVSLMHPGAAGRRIISSGVAVHSLAMRGGVPSLRAALRLRRLVREMRPDLLMGWMHHGQIAASFAAAAASAHVPMIWNVRHSLNGYRQEKPFSRAMLRLGALLSYMPAAIIYNSRAAREQYRRFGYHARRDLVIPNGFDIGSFEQRGPARLALKSIFGLHEDRLVIGMVARNHPMKDAPTLLAAFERVHDARADTHLLIVGEGMEHPAGDMATGLQRLAPDCWTLHGHRSDVASWLAGLDMLVLPSAWGEGFPNIVGEAMAAGVPCLVTDVGDAAWVVGETGRVVAPGQAFAMAAALLNLIELGPGGRDRLGRAARERVQEYFSLPGVVRRYAALCRDHAVRRGGQSPAGALVGGM